LQFTSLLLARSYWGLIKSLNWWDIIDEHFLLGGVPMFDDFERLQGQGVGAVVNLCAERQDDQLRLRRTRMEYLWLPVIDASPPTLEQIRCGLTWIERQMYAGRTVYIHCAAGVGRSATLLACWYVYASDMGVPHVLRFIKARRPQVTLTRRQVRRVHEFATFLLPEARGLSPV
jgi:atypical dual specificity phosphatase